MAKKLGKLLAATAIIGTAVAGGMALYNKYKAREENLDDDFMDFDDDFDDDFEDEDDDASDPSRSYVNITYDKDMETAEEETEEKEEAAPEAQEAAPKEK